jgi:DNA-binding CsgD family transcriptional regulator
MADPTIRTAPASGYPNKLGFSATQRAHDAVLDVCRRQRDPRLLRIELLDVIGRVAPFDAYAWIITDPETCVGCAPLADVPCLPELPSLIRLKYLTTVNRWTTLRPPAATLVAATGGDLSRSLLWRDFLCHYRVSDVASSVYRDRFGCWGFLDLWRLAPGPPFNGAELEFLISVARPICTALRQTQAASFIDQHVGLALPPRPVVLLLSPRIEVRAQTPLTKEFLRLLLPPDEPSQGTIPAAAYNVGAQLLAGEAGADSAPALARVHLTHGLWLTLRAARIGSDQPAEDQDIAVTIDYASPHERCAVFARAFGLTRRETELLRHLVAGGDTRDVAGLMSLSEHTVQDHLKSIFAKTGVRSRRALLARALGT